MADSGCRKCGEEGHFAKECPKAGEVGGGDGKCRNCRQEVQGVSWYWTPGNLA